MKHWWKVLAMGCACVFAMTLMVSCDPKLSASMPDDNDPAVGDANTATPLPDNNHAEDPIESVNPGESTQPNEPEAQPPHEHHYGDWQIVTAPTCATDGLARRTCDGCADTETQILNATGEHDYELTDSTPATCTAAGSQTYTCRTCTDNYTVDLPATDHQYSDTAYDPTCSENGYVVHNCHCGYEYTETLPNTATSVHNFVTHGHTHQCSDCGMVEYDLPIENLDGSYWYFQNPNGQSWAIYFDTFEGFDGSDGSGGNGTFRTYYGELDADGTFINHGTPYLIYGTFESLKISDTEYMLTLMDENSATLNQFEHMFFLEYSITTDENGNTVYQLKGNLPVQGNANSTLTFAGYDLQYDDEH